MRGLSLTQPWATAVALGLKRIETRSWRSPYRGPVLIHAASGFPPYAREFAREELLAGRIPAELPLGAVVAVAKLDAIDRVEALRSTALEQLYGDFSQGRYGWQLSDVHQLVTPIRVRGALGLWTPTPEVIEAVRNAAKL